ncbi:MAG TPA: GNAT family N-acetyltransferase [Planctomycetaceae bacterium]
MRSSRGGSGSGGRRRTFVIEYRRFHNSDPPRLVALWHAARLGRGAAGGFSFDAFELMNFAQRYFDRDGLIVAADTETGDLVGFAHAGFGPNEDESGIDTGVGVICAVVVRPDVRRQGIGRELVRRAEEYLRSRGAETILAGPAAPFDPFYVGLYGGSQPSGFLESDPDAAPFFAALGYEPVERFAVLQRDLQSGRDPMSFKVVTIRRKTQLGMAHGPDDPTWWWMTRYGRLDSLRFVLVPKTGGEPLAGVTILGLDLYLPKWQERVIGLTDLTVPEDERRKGYGQALLLEIAKRLREELVNRLEAHISESNPGALRTFEAAGFSRVDTGVVFRKPA